MTNTIDPGQIVAGFRGRFFWPDGSQMGECRKWDVLVNSQTTDERVLDDPLHYPVWQGSSFTLTFTQLTLSDRIPMMMLNAIKQRKQLWMRFIGEIDTDEGTARYVIDRVTPDGNQSLFHAEVGVTMVRDYNWKVAAVPDVPVPLRTNALGTA